MMENLDPDIDESGAKLRALYQQGDLDAETTGEVLAVLFQIQKNRRTAEHIQEEDP